MPGYCPPGCKRQVKSWYEKRPPKSKVPALVAKNLHWFNELQAKHGDCSLKFKSLFSLSLPQITWNRTSEAASDVRAASYRAALRTQSGLADTMRTCRRLLIMRLS
jgi:hypothetical protein